MKIALIAMSGVRVVNQDLSAAGLNLPGLVERSEVIACLFDVNHHPRGMSAEQLQHGIIELSERLYDPEFVKVRRQRFFRQLRDTHARERARARLSA